MNTWIKDDNGNKCSVEYFGTEAAAKAALDSLKNCRDCTNCSRCSGCSDCSGCWDCSGCSRCSGCSDCSSCSGCSRCSGCSDCSDCSSCSGCSGCSDCSDCSDCSGLYLKCNKTAAESTAGGPPPVPVIPEIHKRVYEASSNPGSLDMTSWHTCANTHCRAGWAVTLAGEEGKALERFYNTSLAAMMIYDASDPAFKINPGRFFDSNADALADMKRLAEAAA